MRYYESMINKINARNAGFCQYVTKDGKYMPIKKLELADAIVPGIYEVARNNDGQLYFSPKSSITDKLVPLPNGVSEKVSSEVKEFWKQDTREKYDKFGLVYKLGVLLYGPPGTGKTCTIANVMQFVIDQGGIAIFNPPPALLSEAVQTIREIEPNIKVLVVFEEFDYLVDDANFLSLLDGELQVDNVVYVATTNYINNIPPRIKNRPGRFRTVVEINYPSLEERKAYLTAKLTKKDQVNLHRWLKLTEGFVIDQIKDLIISVCCYGQPLEESAAKTRAAGYSAHTEDKEENILGREVARMQAGAAMRLSNIAKG